MSICRAGKYSGEPQVRSIRRYPTVAKIGHFDCADVHRVTKFRAESRTVLPWGTAARRVPYRVRSAVPRPRSPTHVQARSLEQAAGTAGRRGQDRGRGRGRRTRRLPGHHPTRPRRARRAADAGPHPRRRHRARRLLRTAPALQVLPARPRETAHRHRRRRDDRRRRRGRPQRRHHHHRGRPRPRPQAGGSREGEGAASPPRRRRPPSRSSPTPSTSPASWRYALR